METDSLTSGLGADKLHELLRICSEAPQADKQIDSDQEKTELLQDFLAEALPVEVPKGDLNEQLTTLCQISGISSGESISNLLNNPKTDINLLRKIRAHFKKKSINAKSKAEHDVANVIYYSAIANALSFHNVKLTSLSYKNLNKSFDKLTREIWISNDLVQLFVKAQKLCTSKL